MSDSHITRFAEERLGAPLVVIHESAHAAAALLLGLPVASVSVTVAGEGGTVIGHNSDDPASLEKFSVCCAAAPAVHERMRVPLVWCQHDIDSVTVTDTRVAGLTGSRPDTWTHARALVRREDFGLIMGRVIPALRDRGTLTGVELLTLVADLPMFAGRLNPEYLAGSAGLLSAL